MTDQNGKVTSYAYDDADRLINVTDVALNVTHYAYDLENNLTSITDAAQHTTSFVYESRPCACYAAKFLNCCANYSLSRR